MAPRARVELVRSSRLASRAPYAYAAVAHDVSRLVFTADLLAAWEVVRRHFGDHDAPSTLLGVAVLGYRDQAG